MDAVHRFLFEDLDIRGALVQLGPAWHEMQARRDYAPPVRDLLGQLAAMTAVIGSNLKRPGRVTFQVQGRGPLRMMVMDCDERLRLRGLARCSTDVPAGPVGEMVGAGSLVLTLQTNDAGNERPYQSHVPLEGDTLSAVFESYLTRSEQTPTQVLLHADEKYACGLFLQKLPDADLYDTDGWNRITQLAATVRPDELALPPEQFLGRMFPEETVRLFDPRPVAHHCPRDEEKVLGLLRSLGRDEVEKTLADVGEIFIHDDICNHDYRYGTEVLEHLFGQVERTLH